MIRVTRLDGSEFYINAEFIQSVESKPDTYILLVNGQSYVVTEPDVLVVERVLDYRRAAYRGEGLPSTRMQVQGGEPSGRAGYPRAVEG